MTRVLPALLVLALAACASAPPPAAVPVGPPPPTPAEIVAAVRAAGQGGLELVVIPLVDPHVEDLRDRATAGEQAGTYAEADVELVKALAISADDPDLLQWRAELAVLRGEFAQAETLAAMSTVLGPKSGPLCRRNWALKKALRDLRGESANVASAQAMLAACTIAPPVRM